MKVLFDALGLPTYGGARTSALDWICSVTEEAREYEFTAVVSRPEPVLESMGNLTQIVAPVASRFRVRIWAQTHLAAIVRAQRIDLVHFTKNLGCFLLPCPTVITINDLNRFHYPTMFSRIDVLYWRTVQRALFKSVDRIIAISENTKRDLLRFYPLASEDIQVVYPSVPSQFKGQRPTKEDISAVLQKYGIRPPYVLSVGGMATHKNVYSALQAFRLLVERGHLIDHTFAIVGGQTHTHSDQRLVDIQKHQKEQHIHFAGHVEEPDLPIVYAGASLFVYPSLYEGFGLAPLEAMAYGVPVLAGQVASLPEALGDAAWMVEDPTDVGALADGMLKLLTEPHTWKDFSERGLRNMERFSWSSTARQTLDLYSQLLH